MARFKKPSPRPTGVAPVPHALFPLALATSPCVTVRGGGGGGGSVSDDGVGVTGSVEMVCEHDRVARVVSV